MNTLDQPLPVLPLDYAKPSTLPRRRRWVRVGQWALLVAAADLLIGWLLMPLVGADSSVVTGPILFLLGLALMVASWRVKLTLGNILGLAHCSICLLFTMLVNVRNWSPNEATVPFTIMGGVYALGVALPMTAVVFLRLRHVARSMQEYEEPT